MAKVQVCDACGKPTTKIMFKLFLTDVSESNSRHHHSHYDRHADIGECCADQFQGSIQWTTRKKKVAKVS